MLIAENIHKSYTRYKNHVKVLHGVDLVVDDGEFLALVGASGSGKSTLMHVLGTLDTPDEGTVALNGRMIHNLKSRERDELRNTTFGFIFQFYHLLPELTTLQNVMMPALVGSSIRSWWGKRREAKKRALEILDVVGLSHRLKHKPRELSGGEMQRTAIARALVSRPKVLFADEPTGNLDSESGDDIIKLLRRINREENVTILMVTHNLELVRHADRVVRMSGGKLSDQPPFGSEQLAEAY